MLVFNSKLLSVELIRKDTLDPIRSGVRPNLKKHESLSNG